MLNLFLGWEHYSSADPRHRLTSPCMIHRVSSEIFYPGVPVTNISPSHRGTQLPTLRETVHLAKVAVDAFINVCCFFTFLSNVLISTFAVFLASCMPSFFFSIFVLTLSCGILFHQSISCHFSKYCL